MNLRSTPDRTDSGIDATHRRTDWKAERAERSRAAEIRPEDLDSKVDRGRILELPNSETTGRIPAGLRTR